MRYSNSRIMRRCGQLGLPYNEAIVSRYFTSQGVQPPSLRIQYRDGVGHTINWGARKRPIEDRHTTPHNLKLLKELLASDFQSDGLPHSVNSTYA